MPPFNPNPASASRVSEKKKIKYENFDQLKGVTEGKVDIRAFLEGPTIFSQEENRYLDDLAKKNAEATGDNAYHAAHEESEEIVRISEKAKAREAEPIADFFTRGAYVQVFRDDNEETPRYYLGQLIDHPEGGEDIEDVRDMGSVEQFKREGEAIDQSIRELLSGIKIEEGQSWGPETDNSAILLASLLQKYMTLDPKKLSPEHRSIVERLLKARNILIDFDISPSKLGEALQGKGISDDRIENFRQEFIGKDALFLERAGHVWDDFVELPEDVRQEFIRRAKEYSLTKGHYRVHGGYSGAEGESEGN